MAHRYPFCSQTRLYHRSQRLPLVVLIAILSFISLSSHAQAHVATIPFNVGDEILLECRRNLTDFPQAFTDTLPQRSNDVPSIVHSHAHAHGQGPNQAHANSASIGGGASDTDEWGPFLKCHESGRHLHFEFGRESFFYCGLLISNDDLYNFLAGVMNQRVGWQCRIPMSKDRRFYLPVVVPLWGVVEPTHIHVNIHSNIVFHTDAGRIIGAAFYPLRDQFLFARKGSVVAMHGQVKWFERHGYTPIGGGGGSASASTAGSEGTTMLGLVLACIFCMLVTATALAMYYVMRLKPMLIKKYLKGD